MMVAGMLMKVLCVAVTLMVVVAPYAEAALTCGQVVDKIRPCFNYFENGGSVPAECCNGVRGVNNDSKSSTDKQNACNCIKVVVSQPGFKNPNTLGLPDKCGVKFPYKFSNMTDCPNRMENHRQTVGKPLLKKQSEAVGKGRYKNCQIIFTDQYSNNTSFPWKTIS